VTTPSSCGGRQRTIIRADSSAAFSDKPGNRRRSSAVPVEGCQDRGDVGFIDGGEHGREMGTGRAGGQAGSAALPVSKPDGGSPARPGRGAGDRTGYAVDPHWPRAGYAVDPHRLSICTNAPAVFSAALPFVPCPETFLSGADRPQPAGFAPSIQTSRRGKRDRWCPIWTDQRRRGVTSVYPPCRSPGATGPGPNSDRPLEGGPAPPEPEPAVPPGQAEYDRIMSPLARRVGAESPRQIAWGAPISTWRGDEPAAP